MSKHLHAGLSRLVGKHPERAMEVRGRGLLLGLVLDEDASPVVARCRERGVLLSVAGGTVVRFAPPLIVGAADLDRALEVLDVALAP